jgi:hypothetical protein
MRAVSGPWDRDERLWGLFWCFVAICVLLVLINPECIVSCRPENSDGAPTFRSLVNFDLI